MPADYSFFDLHIAIQDAMGWTDSHLHGFRIAQKGTMQPICIQYPNPDMDFDDECDERLENVANYLGDAVKQCQYEYDFGDGWTHTVRFERELPAGEGEIYPKCIAGKNACPPEDCGGPGGYANLIQILQNPQDQEYRAVLDWLGIDDPQELNIKDFDPRAVEFLNPRERLKEYKRGFGV